MKTKIYFDMDGTLNDFYNVDGWLDYILKEDIKPYAIAKPKFDTKTLTRKLKELQKLDFEIGIITWLARGASQDYNIRVTQTKLEWLQVHFSGLRFDDVQVLEYGTLKSNYCDNHQTVLFDDEHQNRKEWNGRAYEPDDIESVLDRLIAQNR